MKPGLLFDIIAHFFMLLFVYTGVAKLMEIDTFKQQLAGTPIFGPVAGVASWALPILEILLVIILLVPAWRLRGLYASLIVMCVFTIYFLYVVLIVHALSCSCGGIIADLSPKQHLLFNLG